MPVTDIFPNELRQTVPPLHSQGGITDPIVHARFTNSSGWIWYVIEGSPEDDDFIFFGFVIGLEEEWGYFSLSELAEACDLSGYPTERDPHFDPKPFSQVVTIANRGNDSQEG